MVCFIIFAQTTNILGTHRNCQADANLMSIHKICISPKINNMLTLVLLNLDMPCLYKQCIRLPTDLDLHCLLLLCGFLTLSGTRGTYTEAAAIAMMYMYLYSLAFMDHPCTLGAAVCHQAPPCPLYTQPRARRV